MERTREESVRSTHSGFPPRRTPMTSTLQKSSNSKKNVLRDIINKKVLKEQNN